MDDGVGKLQYCLMRGLDRRPVDDSEGEPWNRLSPLRESICKRLQNTLDKLARLSACC